MDKNLKSTFSLKTRYLRKKYYFPFQLLKGSQWASILEHFKKKYQSSSCPEMRCITCQFWAIARIAILGFLLNYFCTGSIASLKISVSPEKKRPGSSVGWDAIVSATAHLGVYILSLVLTLTWFVFIIASKLVVLSNLIYY